MHFGLTEDQRQFRDTVRAFLGRIRGARQVLEGGDAEDPAVWARICEDQGWQVLLVPEENDGLGFGTMDMAVILEEVGRRLTPCPLLETAFATLALRAAETSDEQASALGAIIEGQPGALALGARVTVRDGGLHGVADAVIGGASAGVLVVESAGEAFLVLDRAGCSTQPLPSLDITRPMARLGFDGTPCTPLRGIDWDAVRSDCAVLVAAEAVGAADATLEMAVDYAKARRQFGRQIGSFQAIQHMCADMMVLIESARSAVWYAAWATDSGAGDAALASRTAKAMACDAFSRCAGDNIQIHGGIGFTWEHDAHLYFKRAQSVQGLLGSPSEHRAAVADALLGER